MSNTITDLPFAEESLESQIAEVEGRRECEADDARAWACERRAMARALPAWLVMRIAACPKPKKCHQCVAAVKRGEALCVNCEKVQTSIMEAVKQGDQSLEDIAFEKGMDLLRVCRLVEMSLSATEAKSLRIGKISNTEVLPTLGVSLADLIERWVESSGEHSYNKLAAAVGMHGATHLRRALGLVDTHDGGKDYVQAEVSVDYASRLVRYLGYTPTLIHPAL